MNINIFNATLGPLLSEQDEFSKNVLEWNTVRVECVEMALKKLLLPDMKKELRTRLLEEAKESVLKACCHRLYNWIKVAPLSVDLGDEDDDDWDTSKVRKFSSTILNSENRWFINTVDSH